MKGGHIMDKIRLSLILALALGTTVASCDKIETDLCEPAEHVHESKVAFRFNWDNANTSVKPETMYVFGKRILNSWKCGFYVNSETAKGEYLFGAPEGVTGEQGSFTVKDGTYKFVTFNKEESVVTFENFLEYVDDDYVEEYVTLQDVNVVYRSYILSDNNLKKPIRSWRDYNPYSQYVQPEKPAVLVNSLYNKEVESGDVTEFEFAPEPLTQQVDVRFQIDKKGEGVFKVDSVFAEISGIPHKMNLADGYLNFDKTYKMLFRMDVTKQNGAQLLTRQDSLDAKSVMCSAKIDVLGIIGNKSEDALVGPGILCVRLYTTCVDETTGMESSKEIPCVINLTDAINDAKLTRTEYYGQFVLQAKKFGTVNAEKLTVIDGSAIEKVSDKGKVSAWTVLSK